MRKRLFNPGSIRFRFFAFLVLLLLILLLLLNFYPYVSVRDAVYQEKEKSMESRAATLASALSGLDRPDAESVAEVLRLLDIQGYDRVTVADGEGRVYPMSRQAASVLSSAPPSSARAFRAATPSPSAARARSPGRSISTSRTSSAARSCAASSCRSAPSPS